MNIDCNVTLKLKQLLFGTVDGNQTRRDLIDSQVSPPGGLYGINWRRCSENRSGAGSYRTIATKLYPNVSQGRHLSLTDIKGAGIPPAANQTLR